MKIRKALVAATAFVLALTGCGGSGGSSSSSADAGKDARTTVKLGVVGTVYEDLWKPATQKLESEGIDVQFVQFADYTTPNNALNSGEIDLNGFQHETFFENDIKQNNYKITNIGYTFIVPLNLYSEKIKSVDELKDGDTVAIPDDPTNGGRALRVLQSAGILNLKPEASDLPTVADIASFNKQVEIKELKANIIASSLPDVTAGIVNDAFALDFGLGSDKVIYEDTTLDDRRYWNIVAARTSDLEDPAKVETYRKVIKAFQTDETNELFQTEFDSHFVKAGWDEDLLAGK
ncbi:D-methionine transport system substrate-binding protein [Actinobaculum suis]|uniref:D-methionine transport system substrate-binding protein n=1 Tax=Actinobaculum suis TaxID=1657 RepID=A0A1G7BD43_9ACTO|nr:MetQ/NlpA family ABC transporter substrate-binding protein [Actinobaculum suis]MDY5153574.1 MetQ/NlpA family ABC transporter substrate-binding protein [Actinobaculum suis]SDE24872.1 D-methionine transport system substrate-binding protein [Actinobaculum suis]